MPRIIELTSTQIGYMRDAVKRRVPYSEMAAHLDMCVDTLKRKLHQQGIIEFEGAKYQRPIEEFVLTWNRPCMRCKCTESRPKNQYICGRCKEVTAEINGLLANGH